MNSALMLIDTPGIIQNWDFKASPMPRWRHRQAMEMFVRTIHRRPAWCALKPVRPKPTWVIYFLYAPDGSLGITHRFTLARLRDLGLPLLVVCSCPCAAQVPPELHGYADALYWKARPGYDFSAYTLALQQVSCNSPGADVIVFNDSVFGPFVDLRPMLSAASWRLTGFTASNQLTEHIQSYAFILKGVDRMTMWRLAPVLFPFAAVSQRDAVIILQEIRLARVAARSMSVGAFWFADSTRVLDPSLGVPLQLVDAGFPFMKRRLLRQPFDGIDRQAVDARLRRLGHPVDW